jgi:hypothetical protein
VTIAEKVYKRLEKYSNEELVDKIGCAVRTYYKVNCNSLDKDIDLLINHLSEDIAKGAYLHDFSDIEIDKVTSKLFDYGESIGIAVYAKPISQKKSLARFVMNLVAENKELKDTVEGLKLMIEILENKDRQNNDQKTNRE